MKIDKLIDENYFLEKSEEKELIRFFRKKGTFFIYEKRKSIKIKSLTFISIDILHLNTEHSTFRFDSRSANKTSCTLSWSNGRKINSNFCLKELKDSVFRKIIIEKINLYSNKKDWFKKYDVAFEDKSDIINSKIRTRNLFEILKKIESDPNSGTFYKETYHSIKKWTILKNTSAIFPLKLILGTPIFIYYKVIKVILEFLEFFKKKLK